MQSRATNLTALGPCTILDVGTGTAQIPDRVVPTPRRLARDGGRSGSVDAGRRCREYSSAARLGGRIKLQHLDAKRLPFKNGQFAVVMTNSIIHHIPAPEECLAEMVRVVARAGCCLCVTCSVRTAWRSSVVLSNFMQATRIRTKSKCLESRSTPR